MSSSEQISDIVRFVENKSIQLVVEPVVSKPKSLAEKIALLTEDDLDKEELKAFDEPIREYNNLTDPLIINRHNAIQSMYQFLREEGLLSTIATLEKECTIVPNGRTFATNGVLLEALDLRTAYHSTKGSTDNRKRELLEKLVTLCKNSEEKPNLDLIYSLSFDKRFKSNLLCVEFARINDDTTYIICGIASRKLVVLSVDDLLSMQHNPPPNQEENRKAAAADRIAAMDEDEKEMNARIVGEVSGLKGPPLFIQVDKKWNRYCVVGCMDGSVCVIDLYSIGFPTVTMNSEKAHSKYVVMAKWSTDSKYILSASHDNKATLFGFDEKNPVFLTKIHSFEFDGCVEAIEWIPQTHECVISVRGSNYLHYYNFDTTKNENIFEPILKCNINAFGDDFVSFAIGDVVCSKDGQYLLTKTDREKVILFGKGGEDQLRVFYGSHSDQFSYTRACFSRDMRYIYASHQNSFVIWDAVTAKLISTVSAHLKTLRDMVLDEKSGYLATVSFDRTLKIWGYL